MQRAPRYLLRLWLTAESLLACLGLFVLAGSFFRSEALSPHEGAASIVCMLLLCVGLRAIWSQVRAEKTLGRASADPS
ncbi:MAG: hypothetical protein V4672_07920 [Verrucomicrobiota bacterium]